MIRIRIFYDGKPVNEYEQASSDKEITIGRAPGCAVRLDEASISRLHALIRFVDGIWVLERKASFGAVLLNGHEVENANLQGGEEITLGKFLLRVQIELGSSASVAPVLTSSNFRQVSLQEPEDGRTRVMGSNIKGLFRFEPGTANVPQFTLEQDIAVFGRGSNCDVVLMDKKASRKHLEVRKQGLSFFLKDLESANGLTINGKKVSDAELVPGDVIQIGESKIEFTIEDKEFFSKQDEFMPVPAVFDEGASLESPGFTSGEPLSAYVGTVDGDSVPGSEAPPPATKAEKLTLMQRYLAMSQLQRIIIILAFFSIVAAAFNFGDSGTSTDKTVKVKKAPPGHEMDFEYLSEANQKTVASLYKDLFTAIEAKQYEKARDLSPRILNIVSDYRDTKEYQRIAVEAIEKAERLQKEKERAEAKERLRKEIEAMEERGKVIFEKALADQKYRLELNQVIQEIYSKDPNDHMASDWQAAIAAKIEQEKKDKEIADAKELLRQKANKQKPAKKFSKK